MRSRDCQKEVRQPIAWMLMISQKKQRHEGIFCDVFHLLVEEPDRADLPAVDRETLLQTPRLSLRPLHRRYSARRARSRRRQGRSPMGATNHRALRATHGGYLHFHERAETAILSRCAGPAVSLRRFAGACWPAVAGPNGTIAGRVAKARSGKSATRASSSRAMKRP